MCLAVCLVTGACASRCARVPSGVQHSYRCVWARVKEVQSDLIFGAVHDESGLFNAL